MNEYSRVEKILHWLALQPEVVRRLSFGLERQLFLPHSIREAAAGSVYVCGLARSGTTLVLQLLDQLSCFRSLTYRDMPFVLAPNLWGLFTRLSRRHSQDSERAHGDGVMIGFDSAESFEEVFWRTFSSSANRTELGYGSCEVGIESINDFETYRALIANPRQYRHGLHIPKRYLSKNNDNLLRFHHLAADATATVVLVYRNPLEAARSLHRQHLRFMGLKDDPFAIRYMGWLGHHEFGPGHIPFSFVRGFEGRLSDADDLEYWVDYWCAVHESILKRLCPGVHLVSYDQLVRDPSRVVFSLLKRLFIDHDAATIAAMVRPAERPSSISVGVPSEQFARSQDIYRELDSKSMAYME